MVMSGVRDDAPNNNKHIVKSNDGKTALWLGAIDDIWELGKPVGNGGPWKNTAVTANTPSDPYLMTGYDKKTLTLSSNFKSNITVEIDITGVGDWQTWRTFDVSETATTYEFPSDFQAYWLRVTSDKDITATAQLVYE